MGGGVVFLRHIKICLFCELFCSYQFRCWPPKITCFWSAIGAGDRCEGESLLNRPILWSSFAHLWILIFDHDCIRFWMHNRGFQLQQLTPEEVPGCERRLRQSQHLQRPQQHQGELLLTCDWLKWNQDNRDWSSHCYQVPVIDPLIVVTLSDW